MSFGTNVGIVGLGFVGSAVRDAQQYDTPITVDIDPTKLCTGTYEDLAKCDAVYVCVPSPMNADGTCDSSILEDVVQRLSSINFKGVIISKVTATPEVYTRLGHMYDNLVYVPEFLTAANAVQDYVHSEFLVVGGTVTAYMREAERIIKHGANNIQNTVFCSFAEASLMKYTVNSFLAAKVIFMNEIKQLADASDVDFYVLVRLLGLDPRIGRSHMNVPGPDGKYGFGGMCFPKDTQALLKYAEGVNIELSVLEAAVKKNTLLRLS